MSITEAANEANAPLQPLYGDASGYFVLWQNYTMQAIKRLYVAILWAYSDGYANAHYQAG